MIFSSNVYRSMCAVESNVIHDRHFCRTLTLCFFAVSILWGWHWFRTGCQAKIGQWASLDSIQSWWTGFSGAWKVMKGWELEWKAKFSSALEGWSCSTGPSNLIYCTIFDIRLDSIINRSFMLMQIYQASHWKSHGFSEGDKNSLQKKASKTYIEDMLFNLTRKMVKNFWCDPCPWMFFVQKYH